MINGEAVRIYLWISQPRFTESKIKRCSIWCRLLNSPWNFENNSSQSKKMDSGNAFKNCYMLQNLSDFNL